MNAKFFLVVPIGLEAAAAQELLEVTVSLQRVFEEQAVVTNLEVTKGGVEFNADQELGLLLNYFLKIPSRILLRWQQFQANDFPVLARKLTALPWKKSYLSAGIGELHIAASQSRLNNEKRIRKVLVEEVLTVFKIPIENKKSPDLYIRMHQDLLTVSIDTTGEHLHLRGYRKQQGEAPLRETFAAYVVSLLRQGQSTTQLNEICWIDPMCGSGTLLFEALLYDQINELRHFTLSHALRPATQQKLKLWKNLPKTNVAPSFWGFDKNSEVINKAKINFKNIQTQLPQNSIHFHELDLLATQAQLQTQLLKVSSSLVNSSQKKWLISNPPYGERLELAEGQNIFTLCEKALDLFKPELALFILPDHSKARPTPKLGDYFLKATYPFLNNGIRVRAVIYTLKQNSFQGDEQ